VCWQICEQMRSEVGFSYDALEIVGWGVMLIAIREIIKGKIIISKTTKLPFPQNLLLLLLLGWEREHKENPFSSLIQTLSLSLPLSLSHPVGFHPSRAVGGGGQGGLAGGARGRAATRGGAGGRAATRGGAGRRAAARGRRWDARAALGEARQRRAKERRGVFEEGFREIHGSDWILSSSSKIRKNRT